MLEVYVILLCLVLIYATYLFAFKLLKLKLGARCGYVAKTTQRIHGGVSKRGGRGGIAKFALVVLCSLQALISEASVDMV